MKFRVSSGLKSIIGKDLITDDFVAIFELVKNSFDAYASRVDLYFDDDVIYVIDDGKGMSETDFTNKWLFVAYSAKADNSENKDLRDDYRSGLRSKRSTFAGNKGVGRFSCDRLGETLQIQSRKHDNDIINQLIVNWDDFEENQNQEFGEIDVIHSRAQEFELPKDLTRYRSRECGTVLKITSLRNFGSWDRKKLLKLKSAIAKLIDPFGVKKDFTVYIHSPKDKDADAINISEWRARDKSEAVDEDSPYLDIVNGKVRNFVFDKLSEKTTRIKTYLSEDCDYIYTELIDRGELVYKIKEPNEYSELESVSISSEIYYMNTRAKINFTRMMGVESVNFGSVFLFNNSFRVYPVGEKNDDTLGLNTRKAQGHSRYLGTREILGMIDVNGNPEKFKESSSRDQGLIETVAYRQLHGLFMEKSLKRLEAYVVNVSWSDKLDADTEDLSRILTDQGKSRVVKVIARLVSGRSIELIDYSEKLIDIVSERSTGFEETIESLQNFANQAGQSGETLQKKINLALARYKELQEAEEESRRAAEQERQAREEAENIAFKEIEENEKARKELKLTEEELKEERKRTLFLKKVASADLKTIIEFHHQIGIYSASLKHLIDLKLDKLNDEGSVSVQEYKHFLESVSLKNQQILTISRVATVADFRMSAEEVNEDVVEFCKQYLENVVSGYHNLDVEWKSDGTEWPMKFSPLNMMVVIENLVHNASKNNAAATKITFHSYQSDKKRLVIEVEDDGNGFSARLQKNINSIFDMGVTTTEGSGLGLYHVRQVINEMNGSIEADPNFKEGAKLVIRFAR